MTDNERGDIEELLSLDDHVIDIADHHRVLTCRWLVVDHDLGLGDNRAR